MIERQGREPVGKWQNFHSITGSRRIAGGVKRGRGEAR